MAKEAQRFKEPNPKESETPSTDSFMPAKAYIASSVADNFCSAFGPPPVPFAIFKFCCAFCRTYFFWSDQTCIRMLQIVLGFIIIIKVLLTYLLPLADGFCWRSCRIEVYLQIAPHTVQVLPAALKPALRSLACRSKGSPTAFCLLFLT